MTCVTVLQLCLPPAGSLSPRSLPTCSPHSPGDQVLLGWGPGWGDEAPPGPRECTRLSVPPQALNRGGCHHRRLIPDPGTSGHQEWTSVTRRMDSKEA